MNRVRIVVAGRVQGVGFRYFVQRHARTLELTGRVWNRSDGRVEIDAEGERSSLEQFVEQVSEGPIAAVVEDTQASWGEGAARYEEFRIQ